MFVRGRFDGPLRLQGPEFDTLVYQLRGNEEPSLLARLGPGVGEDDYLIVSRDLVREATGERLARRLRLVSSLEEIGTSGRYHVYRATRPGATPTRVR